MLREAFRRIHDGLEDTSDMRVAWYDSDDGDGDIVVGDGGVHDGSDYVVVDIVDNDDDDDIDDDYVVVMMVMMIHVILTLYFYL